MLSPGIECGEEEARTNFPHWEQWGMAAGLHQDHLPLCSGAGPWARTQPWLWITEHSPWLFSFHLRSCNCQSVSVKL